MPLRGYFKPPLSGVVLTCRKCIAFRFAAFRRPQTTESNQNPPVPGTQGEWSPRGQGRGLWGMRRGNDPSHEILADNSTRNRGNNFVWSFRKSGFATFSTVSGGPHGPPLSFSYPSCLVFSTAASTASMHALRRPLRSSAATPAMVLPPGLHTSSLSCPGCRPVRSAISALPSSICAA